MGDCETIYDGGKDWAQNDLGRTREVKNFLQLIQRCSLDIHIENNGFQDGIEQINTEHRNILCNSQINEDLLMIPCIGGIRLTRSTSRKQMRGQKDHKILDCV